MKAPFSLGQARGAMELAVCLFALTVPLTIAGANLSWGLLAAACCAFAWAGGRLPLQARRGSLEKPLYFFLAASLTTSLLGIDPWHSLRFLNQDVHKVWIYLLFMTALSVHAPPRTHWYLAAGFALAAVLGIWQSAVPMFTHPPTEWRMFRAHAFVHPVTFGEQMAVAVLGGAAFLLAPPIERPPRRWLLGYLALTTAALFLSGTRGALISTVCGLACMLALEPRCRRALFWLIPLGALGFFLMELQHFSRSLTAQLIGGLFPSLSWERVPGSDSLLRLSLWKAALRIGLDHPLTGVGHNNFRAVLPQYFSHLFEDQTRSWGSAHNIFLHHFAERGLIGLAAVTVLLGAFWWRALERARSSPGGLTFWAFGAASAFLIMNLTETALGVELVWMLVFFVWILAEIRSRP